MELFELHCCWKPVEALGATLVGSSEQKLLTGTPQMEPSGRPPPGASVRPSRQSNAAGSWERNAVSSQRVVFGSEGAHFLIALVSHNTKHSCLGRQHATR